MYILWDPLSDQIQNPRLWIKQPASWHLHHQKRQTLLKAEVLGIRSVQTAIFHSLKVITIDSSGRYPAVYQADIYLPVGQITRSCNKIKVFNLAFLASNPRQQARRHKFISLRSLDLYLFFTWFFSRAGELDFPAAVKRIFGFLPLLFLVGNLSTEPPSRRV